MPSNSVLADVNWKPLGFVGLVIVVLFTVPALLSGDVKGSALMLGAMIALVVIVLTAAIPAGIAAAVAGVIRWSWARQTNRMRGVTVVDYVPPQGYSTLEIGALYDGRITRSDLIAHCLDLAERRLVILENTDEGLRLIPLDGGDPTALDLALLTSLPGPVTLDSRTQRRLARAMRRPILRAFQAKALVRPQTWLHWFYPALFVLTSLVAVVQLWAANWLFSQVNEQEATFSRMHDAGDIWREFWAVWPGMTAILALPYIAALFMVARMFNAIEGVCGGRTKKFAQEWQNLHGYRQFVEQTEVQQLDFELSQSEGTPRMEFLPIAVALSFDVDWRRGLRFLDPPDNPIVRTPPARTPSRLPHTTTGTDRTPQ